MEAKFSIVQDHTDTFADSARLTVIGVGGGGGNAVETMVQNGVKGITFVCANTDRQALDRLSAPNKIQLGIKNTDIAGFRDFKEFKHINGFFIVML